MPSYPLFKETALKGYIFSLFRKDIPAMEYDLNVVQEILFHNVRMVSPSAISSVVCVPLRKEKFDFPIEMPSTSASTVTVFPCMMFVFGFPFIVASTGKDTENETKFMDNEIEVENGPFNINGTVPCHLFIEFWTECISITSPTVPIFGNASCSLTYDNEMDDATVTGGYSYETTRRTVLKYRIRATVTNIDENCTIEDPGIPSTPDSTKKYKNPQSRESFEKFFGFSSFPDPYRKAIFDVPRNHLLVYEVSQDEERFPLGKSFLIRIATTRKLNGRNQYEWVPFFKVLS